MVWPSIVFSKKRSRQDVSVLTCGVAAAQQSFSGKPFQSRSEVTLDEHTCTSFRNGSLGGEAL